MMRDMTKGAPLGHLFLYAVPLLLGNWLQLAYNAVDSIIAGRCIGQDALAAEGVAGPVLNLVILANSGLCIGAGVLMSEAFGAIRTARLIETLATTLLFGAALCCAAAALGGVALPPRKLERLGAGAVVVCRRGRRYLPAWACRTAALVPAVHPGTADWNKLERTGLCRILCRSPFVQRAVGAAHGLAAGMGLCSAGGGLARRRFAVWKRRIPPVGAATGVERRQLFPHGCAAFAAVVAVRCLPGGHAVCRHPLALAAAGS